MYSGEMQILKTTKNADVNDISIPYEMLTGRSFINNKFPITINPNILIAISITINPKLVVFMEINNNKTDFRIKNSFREIFLMF